MIRKLLVAIRDFIDKLLAKTEQPQHFVGYDYPPFSTSNVTLVWKFTGDSSGTICTNNTITNDASNYNNELWLYGSNNC